jgi:hypothetical protein
MSKKLPTRRRKLFNIDAEAKKFYPRNPVLVPAMAGVQAYSVRKCYGFDPVSMRRFTSVMMRRA